MFQGSSVSESQLPDHQEVALFDISSSRVSVVFLGFKIHTLFVCKSCTLTLFEAV